MKKQSFQSSEILSEEEIGWRFFVVFWVMVPSDLVGG
jgi:hypothetical protein